MSTGVKSTELKYWKYNLDQTQYGETHGWSMPDYDDSRWTQVEAYTSWETYELAMHDYEGHGWFRTWIDAETAPDKRFILKFDGVGGVAKVFVNGKCMGTNENRYLPFEIDVTDQIWNGKNLVAVLVDNSFRGREHLTGGARVEWVLYGGLTHHIYLEEQVAAYISHVRADARADGTLDLVIQMHNRDKRSYVDEFEGSVCVEVEGLPECTASEEVQMANNKTASVTFNLKANDPKLWSPDEPNLYNLKVTLKRRGQEHFVYTHRIGFRTIEVRGTCFYLNGKEILLKGANRYDEYYPYGICPPEELIREDLLKMKQCGMNLVRTHYPQDEVHYRIADEIGIMYMIEIPLNWWFPAYSKTITDFFTLGAEAVDCLDRTFNAFCNHACWTIWSAGNECTHSRQACQQMFRLLADRMRSLNSGRLITFAASMDILDEKELDWCDFLSVNYYTGILSEHESQFQEQLVEKLEKKLGICQKFYPNVPHVMTEFGYVCVRGVHGNLHEGRYSEDFGTTFLKADCREILKDPNMKGMIIWSWADYRHRRGFVPDKSGMGFQATYGPWGMVAMDRQPKQMLMDTITEIYNNWQVEE